MKSTILRSASVKAAILAAFVAPMVSGFDTTPYPGPNPPDGTSAYPWKIDLPADFDAIGTDGTHLMDQHYLLTQDLDFGDQDHRVIGTFSGTLDGAYHRISNIRIDQPAVTGVGLIQTLGSGAVVRRLAVVDSYFRAYRQVSPFGSMGHGSRVEECYSQGNEIISVSTNGQPSGGLVSGGSYVAPSAVLIDSFSRDNTISSPFQTVGGVSGYNDARVERCYSAGCTLSAPNYVGGVVGYGGSGTIVDSYSHLTNSPSVQVGGPQGTWQNTLVPDRYTTDLDLTTYTIAQLNWDPAVWTKGADNLPFLVGFNRPEIAVEQPVGTDLIDGAASIDFGHVMPGSASVSKTFTIRNQGTADLTGLAVTIDGANASDFSASALGATTLTPGTSTTFTVTFTPGAVGDSSANLHIASNDADENPFDIALSGAVAAAGPLDAGFDPDANDIIIAMATQADGRILVGGRFTSFNGGERQHLARLDPDGTLDGSFNPSPSGDVYSIAALPGGKILIGGLFTSVGGTSMNRIAMLNADGSLDPGFNPGSGANGIVHCIAVQEDGKILIGGGFIAIDGTTSVRIARLNDDGSLDASFDPGSGANGGVLSMAVQRDGRIVIAGHFSLVDGTVRNRIARLHADGSLDSGFDPDANNSVWSADVLADGKILIGGIFGSLGGMTRNLIARLNADGSVDSGFAPGLNASVPSTAQQADGRILIAGAFTSVDGVARNRVARLHADGSLDMSFDPGSGPNNHVFATALQADGKVLIGGYFTEVDGTPRNRIARLLNEPATQSLTATSATRVEWLRGGTAPETNQVSFELSTDGINWMPLGTGTPIAGGWELSGLNLPSDGSLRASARTTGAHCNGSSGLVEQVASFSGLPVPEIAVEQPVGTDLIDGAASIDFGHVIPDSASVSKTFTITNHGTADLIGLALTIDGANASDFIASALGATTLTPGTSTTFTVTFAPGATGSRSAGLHLASNDFDEDPFDISLTGTGAMAGDVDVSFDPSLNERIHCSAEQPDGRTLIGGRFTTIDGLAKSYLARLNPDGTLDTGFNPDLGGPVFSMAVESGGGIIIGGGFTTVAGIARNHLARLHADGTLDMDYNPDVTGNVLAMAVQPDGKLLIGGGFTSVSGTTRNYLARLNSDGTLDSAFDPVVNQGINAVALQADGKIVFAGGFTDVNGVTRNHIARLEADGTLDPGFNPDADATVFSVAVQADGKVLIAGYFNSVGGTTRHHVARIHADGTLDTDFDPDPDAPVFHTPIQADGKILIGGYFTTVDGTSRNRIARLHADGTLDAGFDPDVDDEVWSSMLQADGKVLIGGIFDNIGSEARSWIARLLNAPATQTLTVSSAARVEWLRGGTAPETTQVTFELSTDGTTWTPLGAGTRMAGGWELTGLGLPASGTVRARARTTGGDYMGSSGLVEQQTSFSSLPVPEIKVQGNGISIANGDTTPDATDLTDFGSVVPGGGGQAHVFTIDNSGDYPLQLTGSPPVAISGSGADRFSVVTQPVSPIPPGGSSTFGITFTPSLLETFQATVTIPSNDPDENPFTFDIQGTGAALASVDPDFNPDVNDTVYCSAVQPDGKVLIGGTFSTVNGDARNRFARLNPDGSTDLAFDPGVNDAPFGIAIQPDGKIVIGGAFTTVGGVTRNRVARLNPDGSLDSSFDPNANHWVYSVSLQPDGKILIGGQFGTVGGLTRNKVARLEPDGTVDPGFVADVANVVRDIEVQEDGCVLISGYFSAVNGEPRDRVARLHPDGSLDTGFAPVTGFIRIYDMAIQADGKIILGGYFQIPGGARRLNPDGTLDPSFAPNTNGGSSVLSTTVQADGKILIAGSFRTVGGVSREFVARFQTDGTLDAGFNAGVSYILYSATLQADGRIIVSGLFSMVDSEPHNRVARLLNDPVSQVLSVPDAGRIQWLRGGSAAETTQAGFMLSTDGATWTPLGYGHRVTGGWELTGIGLPSDGRIRAFAYSSSGGGFGLVDQQLSYTGLLVPEISVEQPVGTGLLDGVSVVDFGQLPVASGLQEKTFTVINSGTVDLTGLAVTTDGPHSGDFEVGAPGATTLAPGASTTFTVTFTPTATGARSAALHLASNDADENPFDIALSGTGLSPLEVWRLAHFGTTANTGDAANDADTDRDGVCNLIEFAFGLDPDAPSAHLLPQWLHTGSHLVCTFTRPVGVGGITYGAEWSPNLAPGTWQPLINSGADPEYSFSLPIDGTGMKYARLKIIEH